MTFQHMDAATLRDKLKCGLPPGWTLLDVRTREEFVGLGHIEGATLLPLHELPARFQELSAEAPLVVYCQHGVRSQQACWFLASQGFTHIYNLTEGFVAWEDTCLD
jgi:rhodanese-related sulfurtransferase